MTMYTLQLSVAAKKQKSTYKDHNGLFMKWIYDKVLCLNLKEQIVLEVITITDKMLHDLSLLQSHFL